jgi:hypothetical protein
MAPHTGRYTNDAQADRKRTPAQWYCLLAGAALLLMGLLGFIVNADFSVGNVPSGTVEGDALLGFEVNGWHNVVHLASGLVLLAAANTRPTAKAVALTFGLVYGLVAIIGIIDGRDVLGLIPVNNPDHILHVALATLGILAALVSKTRKTTHSRVHSPETTEVGNGRFDRDTTTGNIHSNDPATGSTRAPR